MAVQGLDAFIVGSEDRHQSEYVSEADMRRAFVSGFTGSAGTVLVLKDKALLWTDGRYFLQASQELSADWTLMRSGEKGVPDMTTWILSNMAEGQVVGIDSWLVCNAAAQALMGALSSKGVCLRAVETNPVDAIWTDRPAAPSAPLIILPLSTTGLALSEKVGMVRERIASTGAVGAVITALDEVAWLLNLRGGDIPYNPVFFAYAIITASSVKVFLDLSKVTAEVTAHLGDGVEVAPYEAVEDALKALALEGLVLAEAGKVSWRLFLALGKAAVSQPLPIALAKAVKTKQELDGMRACHVRDGVALTAFLHWLETTVTAAPHSLTECNAADKLEEFRGAMAGHRGPSFATIAGYGAHGAIIHYKPEPATAKTIGTDNVFLLDSGGQYLDGTTDVTRTVHFGTPTEHQKTCYTGVLKGHIGLARIVIPEGVLGSRIDAIARLALWNMGLDYMHGTGHGVGAFLNVHEGPQGIGFRPRADEQGFLAGMTISNEPGYYEDGAFGIRIETIMVAVPKDTPHRFNGRQFLGFETITMTPICTRLMDLSLLDDEELAWINAYHAQVREKLSPLMQEHFPQTVDYLIKATEPITRG